MAFSGPMVPVSDPGTLAIQPIKAPCDFDHIFALALAFVLAPDFAPRAALHCF